MNKDKNHVCKFDIYITSQDENTFKIDYKMCSCGKMIKDKDCDIPHDLCKEYI